MDQDGLGMEVGLGAGHIVPIFVPFLLWTNGWMDQDATLYGGRPRPRPHCVRRGPSLTTGEQLLPEKKGHSPPIFSLRLLWPNGWMDQDATLYGDTPRPMRHCVKWDSASPKSGTSLNFRPMSIMLLSSCFDYLHLFSSAEIFQQLA